MIETLTWTAYEENALKNPAWKSYRARWSYHAVAIEIVKSLDISSPRGVLEIGPFGANVIQGSDTMDLPSGEWRMPDYGRTIRHDARSIPWPFQEKRYELLIALRVWHHLAPFQEEAFREAKRIAHHIIIACPENEIVGVGVARGQFLAWNDGIPPSREYDLAAWGKLYFWSENDRA
ncbi:MAG: hypothetical protein U1D99_03755 [Candidatus Omnitrophota bacterium]|nr:hypothetical protein [Candidatus Omnitrophota bacterium]